VAQRFPRLPPVARSIPEARVSFPRDDQRVALD